MASFDPSVISTIPDNGPDPIAAKGRAYTLASLIDQQQLGRMKLNQEQSEQRDMGKIKDILGKSDLSTYEGQSKASEAAIKINPKLGMDLQRGFAERQSAKYEKETQDLKVFALQQDHIAGALDSVLAEADTMRREGKSDALINAKITASTLEQVERLKSMQLPNGQPVLSPQVMQQLAQQMGQGPLTYDKLRAIEAQSNKGQQLIKERLAERGMAVKEAGEAERERADRAREDAAAKKAAAADGGFSGPSGQLMAALAERGVSLPAGFRSKAQQKALLEGLIERNPKLSIDELAEKIKAGQIQMGAEKKETTIAAGIAGKIRYAEEEITRLVPKVQEAAAKVPRKAFVPFNRLRQMADSSISDPNLKQLKSYLTTLSNSYDVLAARGGTDVEKRKHNREMLDSADGPEALQAAIDAIVTEAKVSGEAAQASMKPSGASESGVKPYDDADKEARYQAWKKAHGG